MIRFLIIPAVLLLVLSIDSCSRSPVDSGLSRVDTLYIHDTMTAVLKGRLHGMARLVSYTTTITDYSGITVSMEGTPYSAVTDSAGNWTMKDLPTGAYTIVYAKDGYQTYRIFGYQFVGGGDVYQSTTQGTIAIVQTLTGISITDFKLTRVEDKGTSGIYYYYDGVISPRAKGLSAIMFVGRDTTVSSDSSTYVFAQGVTLDTSGHFEQNTALRATDLYDHGLKKGEQIWVVAYVKHGPYAYVYPYPYYSDPRCNCYAYLGAGSIRSNLRATRVP